MANIPACPNCKEDYTYVEDNKYICPMCFHEWDTIETIKEIKDSNGNLLNDGDTVIVIKDLKIKGASSNIKKGTKVKNIKLDYDAKDDHDINCKIDGIGAIKLKSSVVKK